MHALRIVRPGDGDQQITADVLSEPAQVKIRLNSTVDPGTRLRRCCSERVRNACRRPAFSQNPPHVNLTATARTFSDLDTLNVAGHLTLNRLRYRGVGLNRLQSDFTYENHALSCKHFTLDRDEGSATGDSFAYDFSRHEVRLDNIRATARSGAGLRLDRSRCGARGSAVSLQEAAGHRHERRGAI